MVVDGKRVAIEYTLSLDDGTTADGNVGEEPLAYNHGGGEILPALEAALTGMSVDQTKRITLSPEEGYGLWSDEATRSISSEVVPEDLREVGTVLSVQSQDGETIPARVHEVSDETVVLDFNHPLAGQRLHFEVRIVSVE